MDRDRIKEIAKEAETRYNWLMRSVIEVDDVTLDDLPKDRLRDFKPGRLYEFLPYRGEFGGRIIFECVKEGEEVLFKERYRIYVSQGVYGIERRDSPAYMEGIGRAIYRRIPDGAVILDIGCGTAKYLKTINDSERTILAMDMSRDLIEENRREKGLDRVHFFPGDAVDLSYIRDAEIDYLTGINMLNVLHPEDVVKLLAQGYRIARYGLLFGFTLPAKSDFWARLPEEDMDRVLSGLNDPSASLEEKVVAADLAFSGQMNLFNFVSRLCKEWNWTCRIFRFLDRYTMEKEAFFKTDDSEYIGYGNNALLKVLEYPTRLAAHLRDVPEGRFLIHAIGYGMEIYFLPEQALEEGEGLYYFDGGMDFEKVKALDEMREAIDHWRLPFDKGALDSMEKVPS